MKGQGSMESQVGPRIREIRKAAGVSGYLLAKQTGLSRGYLHMVETGKSNPSSEVVLKIANALTVSPNRLMDYVNSDNELSDEEIMLVTAYREQNYGYILRIVADRLATTEGQATQ